MKIKIILFLSAILLAFAGYGQTRKAADRKAVSAHRPIKKPDKVNTIQETDVELCTIDVSSLPRVMGKNPVFPGGDMCLENFIKENIRIPTGLKAGTGFMEVNRVSIQLDFDAAGKVISCKISHHVPNCDSCDLEALRLIKIMPKWIPAQDGEKNNISGQELIRIYFVPEYYANLPACNAEHENGQVKLH